MAAAALVPALALAGCGTATIDNGEAEQLVRQAIARGNGSVKVKSVSCPSGVTDKAGATFDCKVSLMQVSNGSVHNGFVTLHMVNGKGQVAINPSDFHVQ